MKNNSPEQNLIDNFLEILNKDKVILSHINSSCRGSHDYADIEFISTQKEHWVIEAKSHDTSSNHNAAHLLFGELLKETGKFRVRKRGNKLCYGLLLSDDDFFAKKFRLISRIKYIRFGKLIPINTIFVLKEGNILKYTWLEFYDQQT